MLTAAEAAGLLSAPPDYGRPPVADAQTTVIRVTAGGGPTFTHEIYALSEMIGDASGLTERQQTLRRDVAAFVGALSASRQPLLAPAQTTEPVPFRGEAIAIRAQAVPPGGESIPGTRLEPQVMDWPLPDVDPEHAHRCVVVRGAEAEKLTEVLDDASSATRFRWNGIVYALEFRPLLPNEEGCDAVVVGT